MTSNGEMTPFAAGTWQCPFDYAAALSAGVRTPARLAVCQ